MYQLKPELSWAVAASANQTEEISIPKKGPTEEQIIAILKQTENGLKTAEVCRQHGVSEQTLYRWKAKYSGMEGSDSRKLREVLDENRKLKSMVAELSLDNRALKDVLSKNW